MATTDTALVEVNQLACRRVAELIAAKNIPTDAEESSLSGFSREDIGDFYLFLVGICHQTTPVGALPLLGVVDGRERRGWDYLLGRFEEAVRFEPKYLTLDYWRSVTGEKIASLFADSVYGRRLVEVDRRAELIRNLAAIMDLNGWSHLDDLYRIAQGRVATSEPNLVSLLSKFEAYRDPVNKKSFYLLALMRNNGLWSYVDEDQLGPPVDYHEIRGHLRLGTVSIISDRLRAEIVAKVPVDEFEDTAIRRAVYQAIMTISNESRIHDPARLHYLFWNVFRSCCQRHETHCDGCPPTCPLPDRYVPLAVGPNGAVARSVRYVKRLAIQRSES